ncbi:hypothetical protein EYF80_010003 [Liparis tanakae]|uniref:Uncharacterized protein n=1 Tax=Liparis tanakae TaxID=230148 RepID=A0A4Z2IP22_9TELE|nr:hypothetical protein EYF80_010003 [Liparis tanakae]
METKSQGEVHKAMSLREQRDIGGHRQTSCVSGLTVEKRLQATVERGSTQLSTRTCSNVIGRYFSDYKSQTQCHTLAYRFHILPLSFQSVTVEGHNGPEKINPSKEGFGTFHLQEIPTGGSSGVHKCPEVHIFKSTYTYNYCHMKSASHNKRGMDFAKWTLPMRLMVQKNDVEAIMISDFIENSILGQSQLKSMK